MVKRYTVEDYHAIHRKEIMWILANSGRKMERSRLRRCAGIKLADLNLILSELARDGKIRITGEIISLI